MIEGFRKWGHLAPSFVGGGMIAYYAGLPTLIGVVLLMWGNNWVIDRVLTQTENPDRH